MKEYNGYCPEMTNPETWCRHPEYQAICQYEEERAFFEDWFNSDDIQGSFEAAKAKMKRPDLIFNIEILEYAFNIKAFAEKVEDNSNFHF